MRTIATLNLPATTSGTWKLAPPWAAPAVQSLLPLAAAAPLPAGVEPHAPTTIVAAATRLARRSRVLVMDPPPHRPDEAPDGVRVDQGRAPLRRSNHDHAESRFRTVRTEG